MKYTKSVERGGIERFAINEDITLEEFRSLMSKLSSALGSPIEWISMPEAEVGKIKLANGEIYAKLDFDYGLDVTCEGLDENQVSKTKTILSTQ